MSQKRKKHKSDLVSCNLCNVTFATKDSTLHSTICSDVTIFKPYDLKPFEPIVHGYVVSDTLLAKIVDNPGTDVAFPFGQERPVILLNILTMKCMGFAIGDPLVVDHKWICRAWPDDSIAIMNAGLSGPFKRNAGMDNQFSVAVYTLTEAHNLANEVTVALRKSSEHDINAQFRKYVTQKLVNSYVTIKSEISFSFCGKPFNLKVIGIIAEDQGNISMDGKSSGGHQLEKQFESMRVSDPPSNQRESYVQRTNRKFFKVTQETKINFKASLEPQTENLKSKVQPFGGYMQQIQRLQHMLDLTFENPGNSHLPFEPSRGALVYGPTGCGKTTLCQNLIASYEVHAVHVTTADIWSKFHGESEKNLVTKFTEAKEKEPCIILLDDVDCLCVRRDTSQSDVEKRVASTLLTLFDDLVSSQKQVFVLATSSKRENIDPALRRPGRLDREIELPVPSSADRLQILKTILNSLNVKIELSEQQIKHITDNAHGYVGADLAVLCRHASMQAMREFNDQAAASDDVLKLLPSHFHYATSVVRPSAMREMALEVPQVRWEDIGGQHELKQKLKQAIEWPIKHPEAFERLGIAPPKGLLMYGPPGCSKTMIAKALARESGLNFIAIKGPELFSKWVGESERAVRELFRKARSAAPAIVFFDEIDALAGERGGGQSAGGGGDVSDRVLAQLLTEIDGVEALHDVTIVAATNRPDRIDKALLRPGRLDRIVYVSLPDATTRQEIFRIQFRKMPVADDIDLDALVARTHRYSGAEVAAVCREAALGAMQEDIDILCTHARHFEAALEAVTPRTTDSLIDFYAKFAQKSSLHSI